MVLLPQMKSIWLDEDEEAEKLYGLQAQQFMGPDDEGSLAIRMVNSDKPLLSNKKKIDLKPLTKTKLKIPRSPVKNPRKPKSGFFSLFKGKEGPTLKNKKISTPFQFQHISHADAKAGFESDDEEGQEPHEEDIIHPSCSEGCNHNETTEEALLKKRVSQARMSYSGSISTSSSRISRFSSGAGRIVSTSTMATSIQNCHSRVPSLNNLGKNCVKVRNIDDGDGTLDFLKNYDFPSELGHDVLFTFTPDTKPHKISTPIIEAESCYSQEISLTKKSPTLSRTKSDPQLLSTPQLETRWFEDGTPATRKSLDEVLRCYHQPSEENSPLKLVIETGSPFNFAFEEQSLHVDGSPLQFCQSLSSTTSPLKLT
ncbi:uncharacterized protein ZBAI_03972 [Zygosaccharomyces bailii ISA1307]|nr:uncharacterized protein ZBAI_03972 [Zygosaccharomyces bailii ISA1307]